MKQVSFEEVGSVMGTFLCGGEVQAGMAVSVGGSDTVKVCADGERPCGVVASASGGCAGVQLRGAARMIYSGTDVGAGWEKLAGDGTGKVKKSASGTEMLVLSVDTADKTAVVLL